MTKRWLVIFLHILLIAEVRSDGSLGAGIAGGFVSGTVVTFIIVGSVYGILRRKRTKSAKAAQSGGAGGSEKPSTSSASNGTRRSPMSAYSSAPDAERPPIRVLPPVSSTRILISQFENYVNKDRSCTRKLLDQYKLFPAADASRINTAITSPNAPKNSYKNISPYDETRVVLNDGNLAGDYINASFIKGYGGTEKAYIAAQGPITETVTDFWRMIWLYHVNRIVMLTNLVENCRPKCSQYWPALIDQKEIYGKFTVELKFVTVSADYVVRTMKVSKKDQSRTVYQFHFTTWEDKTRPTYGPLTLLDFRKRVRAMDRTATGPMVVHSSAGVGRTGTFIALDILLQQILCEGAVDVFQCVQKLRKQRLQMVQSEDQYLFIHDAIVEAIKVGNSSYPLSTFSRHLNKILQSDSSGINEVHRQFEFLTKLKDTPDDSTKEGLSAENKAKNRDPTVIPADSDRPYLYTRTPDGTNYINAVYVDSFRKHRDYIVTQMPLPNTQSDFWRLVYDHKINLVFMLYEPRSKDKTCSQYWPDEGTKVYGPISVRLVSASSFTGEIMLRTFEVKLVSKPGGSEQSSTNIMLKHYQLYNWPDTSLIPRAPTAFMPLIAEILKWYKSANESYQMAVHCRDGVTRSGLFCGAVYVVDQMRINKKVDVFLAARFVSRTRPQFFKTEEEYRFLYDIASKYIETADGQLWKDIQ